MIDFSKKWYIVFSVIPGINMFLWFFTIFYCIYKSELKKKLPIIIIECAMIAIAVYLIPQKIIGYFDLHSLSENIINFINISFTFFILDLNLRRIVIKYVE